MCHFGSIEVDVIGVAVYSTLTPGIGSLEHEIAEPEMTDEEQIGGQTPEELGNNSHIPPFSSTLAGKRKPSRWRKFGRMMLILNCFACAAFGTIFGLFYWKSATLRDLFSNHMFSTVVNTLKGDPTADWSPGRQFADTTTMNVLILGCDHDYDNKDQIVRNTWGRSDSIMLARFDFVGKKVQAVTIPRDTAVRIPGYRSPHKINAAHSYGGPTLLKETVEKTLGVKVDAVVEINFEGFQQIVDTIGGIDLNVEKKLDYDDNWGHLHIHLKPGEQHMDGYKAMGYVRMRHSDSDEMRSMRQHNFIEAMRSKIKQPSTFLTLPSAVDRLADNLKHYNMSQDQMFTLVNFARGLPKESISIETLPSFEGRSFVTLDAVKSAKVIERVFFPNTQTALNINTPDPEGMRPGSHILRRRRRLNHPKTGASTSHNLEGKPPVIDGTTGDSSKPTPDSIPPPTDGGTPPPPESGTKPG